MTNHIDENLPMAIPEQAAEWLLRWHCGDLSTAERYEYLQWLKTSPVHIAETLRMCRLYSWLENTKLKLFLTSEDTFSNVVIVPPPEIAHVDPFEAELARAARSYPVDTEALVRNAREELARRALRSSWLTAAAAAVISAVAVLATSFIPAIIGVEGIQTEAGEWRSVPLTDATQLVLGPHSHARREYDETRRVVVLKSGEALFKVTKDSRPFLVRARAVTVRAVGTEFAVSLTRSDRAVTVTVQEGRVAVSLDDRLPETVYVHAGEQLQVANDWPVVPRRIDAERELSWASKRLTFVDGDTIGRAVEEFNRRNVLQIEFDSALAGRPVRGSFDAADPLSFAQTIGRTTANVVTHRTADNTVRLEVGRPPPGGMDRGAPDDR